MADLRPFGIMPQQDMILALRESRPIPHRASELQGVPATARPLEETCWSVDTGVPLLAGNALACSCSTCTSSPQSSSVNSMKSRAWRSMSA